MVPVISFFKAHWRPIAFVVALVAAFGAGRFATPTKVETKTEVQFQDKIVYQDRVVEVKTQEKAQDKVQVVYVDRTVTPDGTVHEKSETRTETVTEVKKQDAKQETQVKTEDVKESAKTDKIVTADAPRFTVSLLAAYQFGGHGLLAGSGFNLIPNVGPLSLGLQLQYRVAGPLQIGLFGLTTGVAGVSLGLTF